MRRGNSIPSGGNSLCGQPKVEKDVVASQPSCRRRPETGKEMGRARSFLQVWGRGLVFVSLFMYLGHALFPN